MSDIPPLHCANHPTVETGLRCNSCDKPICAKCAVRTPTGYRCKECVRNQQKKFDTATWYDPVIAFLIAVVLAFLGSLLANVIGFFIIFLAPLIGIGIEKVIRFVTQRRRSRYLYQASIIGIILGCLPLLFMAILNALNFGIGGLLGLLWLGLYAFTVTSTVLYRMRGIRIG